MGGRDRRPLPHAPDSGHYEVASDRGGQRAAAIYSLIESAKLNGLNPQRYLADVLTRIADHPARRIAELLPWNWQPADITRAAA
jgi:transposase